MTSEKTPTRERVNNYSFDGSFFVLGRKLISNSFGSIILVGLTILDAPTSHKSLKFEEILFFITNPSIVRGVTESVFSFHL